jgi:hypothetical protein
MTSITTGNHYPPTLASIRIKTHQLSSAQYSQRSALQCFSHQPSSITLFAINIQLIDI